MTETAPYDVLIIGGGPAGLSAALNLGRSLVRVLVVDADRPRNAATLNSHGFLTRDGVPPHELRRIAREELAAYPNVEIRSRVRVAALRSTDAEADGVRFDAEIGRREPETTVSARSVLLATGLRETLPDVPNLRGFYGMSLFSCAACDAWELQGRRLALIGESADLAARARLIGRWTETLTVFTNGADVVSTAEEAELAAAGVAVRRHPIVELVGDRGRLEAIRLADGATIAVDGGFVRPEWETELSFLDGIVPTLDEAGHLVTDRSGRTDVPGLYAAGDAATPGPQQLIVAAGAGARVAAVIVHDTIGVATAH
ncbi:NAD(P)/FAD-dependent oxidoreductase [Microbacterium sp. TPD7012]|uniref:NAD(P)/FAD-dependent oxidoreductase n=1 Tax=Microbacterium sp. TPD7012 TaxID=2171975 RepID=UPI000D51AFDA|nr:NAD(P)/FAD-dependent oxidoreductase [Microbacterium sp. TPD7012]PVE98336.1 pyridine nucleotide-disulfide oxidoreductase [Microbacterium sp. TPD7012]